MAAATVSRSCSVGRGVIRSTIVVTKETFSAIQAASVGVDGSGEVAHDAGDDRAVVREVVAGHDGERPGAGGPAGGEPGDEPPGRRPDGRSQVLAQRVDVGAHVGPGEVETAVGAALVAGLGDRQRHDRRPAGPAR